MTALPEPTVRTSAYTVSVLPEDDINYKFYAVRVERRGSGVWIVEHQGAQLHPDGSWRDHDYFSWPDADTALARAREAAPHITVNRRSVTDVLRAAADRKEQP